MLFGLPVQGMAGEHGNAESTGNRLFYRLIAAEFQPQIGAELQPLEVVVNRHPGSRTLFPEDESLLCHVGEREGFALCQGMASGTDHDQRIGHENLVHEIHIAWRCGHHVNIVEVVAQAADDAVAVQDFAGGDSPVTGSPSCCRSAGVRGLPFRRESGQLSGGFNRSMQHTKSCESRRSVANEIPD